MTVKELIDRLSEVPPETEVYVGEVPNQHYVVPFDEKYGTCGLVKRRDDGKIIFKVTS